MRICLMALPWSTKDCPSAALGAWAAYLRRERPKHTVECKFEYLKVAASIGFPLYDAIAGRCWDLGELLYLPMLYPEKRHGVGQFFLNLKQHLDEVAVEVATGYDLVGLTTCFGQVFSNVSLSKRIKKISPRRESFWAGPASPISSDRPSCRNINGWTM